MTCLKNTLKRSGALCARLPFLPAALLFLSVVSGACADLPLDIPDRPLDWLLLPVDSVVIKRTNEFDAIVHVCSEMGWGDREYLLRNARLAISRLPGLESNREEEKRLSRLAVRTGRDEEALLFFHPSTTEDPALLAAAGLASIRVGRTAEGIDWLQKALDSDELDPHAADLFRFRMASAMREMPEYEWGVPLLIEISKDRKSRFRSSSRREAAHILFDQKRPEEALSLLEDHYGSTLKKLTDRDLLHRSALLKIEKGKTVEGAVILRRILERWTADPRATDCFRTLHELEERGSIREDPRLSIHGSRAARYAGEREEAFRLLEPYLELSRKNPLFWEGLLEIGIAFYGIGEYEDALHRFRALSVSKSDRAREGALYIARCFKRMGKWRQAVDAYTEYVKRYPRSSIAAEVQWEIAWRLRMAGEHEEAAAAFRKVRSDFPKSEFAPRAPFFEALSLDPIGRPEEALSLLEKMTRLGAGGRDRDDALFWIGDLKSRINGGARNETIYREVIDEYAETYYGIRAASRIGERSIRTPVSDGGTPRSDPLLEWICGWNSGPAGGEMPDVSLLHLYVDAGEIGEAGRVADRIRKRCADDPVALLFVARVCRRAGLYSVTIPCARRIQYLAEQAEADRENPYLLALIYPLGHLDHLMRRIEPYVNIGPFFVLSLMRQESWFHAGAQSPADARGLLQVLPSTGRRIAAVFGEEETFTAAALFDADRNIRYGLWYLDTLMDRYSDDLLVVASAYNAGEGRADQWISCKCAGARGGYIEAVNFSETRDYMKRVLSGYWIYRYVYQDIASGLYQ